MANENKPQSGGAGTGAKVGDAGHEEQGRDAGGSGERSGAGEKNTVDSPKRGATETNSPRKPG